MGGVGNFQNFIKLGGGANKLKWAEKIENSVIDPPPTIREGRVLLLLVMYSEVL